jgi:hypothetical protein
MGHKLRVVRDVQEPPYASWVQWELDDHWEAWFRITPQDGYPVIAEIRLFPRESKETRRQAEQAAGHKLRAAQWTAELLGEDAEVPQGGIPARLLRRLRVKVVIGMVLASAQRPHSRLLRLDYAKQLLTQNGGTRQPRQRLVQLAALAAMYVELLDAGEQRPNRIIADRLSLTPEQVRDRIHEARRAELLTDAPGRGRAGGALTERGRQLLAQAQDDEADQ